MGCTSPLEGHQAFEGAPLSFARSGFRPGAKHLSVPCGMCTNCRLDRSRQAAVRCVHESQMHDVSVFVTLTYSDEHLPPGGLFHRHVQLFLKRLRRAHGSVRYYVCGEYGETTSRAHYHACLFGWSPGDRVLYSRGAGGFDLYQSAELDDLWGLGQCLFGWVTFESAAYCARYIFKKELGPDVEPVRSVLDVTTGELLFRRHEYSRASLKPGIGLPWLEKFWQDVYPHGFVTLPGNVKVMTPRYYDAWYEQRFPHVMASIRAERQRRSDLRFDENSPARLRVHDEVTKARIRSLTRK